MNLESTLVLCDLDALMLGPDGNLTQVLRDVLQLFTARGGRMTVFSQKTPKAVRTILGSVPLAAPALLCGGALVYSFLDPLPADPARGGVQRGRAAGPALPGRQDHPRPADL